MMSRTAEKAMRLNPDASPGVFHRPGHRVHLMGVPFDRVNETQFIEHVIAAINRRHGGFAITANLDHLHRANYDPDYAALMRQSKLIVADGMPIVWASHLTRRPLPERVAGSSLIFSLTDAVARSGRRVFFLGGPPGSADEAAAVLQERCPQLDVAGTYCPPLGFERHTRQWQEVRRRLADADPDLVYVALGSPKQEQVIQNLRDTLPHTWWLGVGISFSFVAGRVRRAPSWMQHLSLEWVHRLAQEPRRLAHRYLVCDLPFAVRLFANTLMCRFFHRYR